MEQFATNNPIEFAAIAIVAIIAFVYINTRP
jgi:hypothetical protein